MNIQAAIPAPSISPPSRAASSSPGAPATTPSSAPRCRSSARACARRSTCAATSASSMSPPATAMPRSPPPAASPTSCRPTMSPRCSSAAPSAPRPSACRSPSRQADAEALPFDDASFDVVLSTFGVMFTPDQEQAASELLRVCRPGGKIGLANWTPDGFIGQLFKTIGKHVPPAPGVTLAGAVGQQGASREPVRPERLDPRRTSGTFVFRYRSPEHWLEIFRDLLRPGAQGASPRSTATGARRSRPISAPCSTSSTSPSDGTLVAPSDYLEVVVTREA